MMVDQSQIDKAAQHIKTSQRLVVMTGAGISKESGVPTFRDALEGLWARYDAAMLATPEAFRRDPKLVWEWYEYRRDMVRTAAPNPAHVAVAALESLLLHVVVVTQNVDDLHQRAGSTDVVALHGAIMQSRCFDACRGEPTRIDVAALDDPAASPLRCPHCGAWVRPDVVWFGEVLPGHAITRAQQLAADADVMLVIGTSGVVQPAASLPYYTRQAGGVIIEVNPITSEITPIADMWLAGPAGEIMPLVISALQSLS